MPLKHYRELIAWQKAMDLVESVYTITSCFPSHELYGLAAQIHRAAVSVPSNIAEGQGRNTTRDFVHFLGVARGSLREVETQITIATRLGYIEKQKESDLLDAAGEVSRLLNGLVNSHNSKVKF